MAGLTSSVPAACQAILAVLAGVAAGSPGMLVFDTELGVNVPPEWLLLEKVSNWVQSDAGLGNLRRDESFDVECVVHVYDGGTGGTGGLSNVLRVRGFALLEEVVQGVFGDVTLAGSVRFARVVGGPDIAAGVTGNGGWFCEIPFTVLCSVQIER